MIEAVCRKCPNKFEYDPDTNLFKNALTVEYVGLDGNGLIDWKCPKCRTTFAITVRDAAGTGVFTQWFSESTGLVSEHSPTKEESVKIEQVKKLDPLDKLCYWIKERESIRLKKEAGKDTPWTDDIILRTYRFCNVRRMDDKVSRWLLDRWFKPYFNHPRMLQAVALARFINKPESLSLVTDYVFASKSMDYSTIKKILRRHRDAGNIVFGHAYMIAGKTGIDKIECVVDLYVKPIAHLQKELDTSSMERCWEAVHACFGFGSFMAGQIVADARHALVGDWSDRMTWAPIGPGSQRGMNRLHSRDTHTALSQDEFLEELRDLHKTLKKKIPATIYDRLELHDVQNCLCEYDKMCRTLNGEGKPKQQYRRTL